MGMTNTFPAWLSARLAQLDMTPAALARAVPVHGSTVSRWLSGARRPTDGLIPKLSEALHVQSIDIYTALGGLAPSSRLSPLEIDVLYELRALPTALQVATLDIVRRLRDYWELQEN